VDTNHIVSRARRTADYIAGMTDRYAVTEHTRWCKDTPDLH
jgi:dGTPase